ncbi:hydrogenase iron-sulfur subunit [candidate division WOR-3 bacterium]|nr:hydrogenase iron-sulfur subunit [candidate division WOR-3 bacterium]
MSEFEPRIVGFLCNWCTYAGADLAGTSRIQYPPNMKPIRVMCSAAVDSVYIVRALMEGADGVFIGGCHPGDCHYVSGNYKTRRRMVLFNSIMRSLGLDQERVLLRWISAAEGKKFADTITEFTEKLRKKGPSPFKTLWEV